MTTILNELYLFKMDTHSQPMDPLWIFKWFPQYTYFSHVFANSSVEDEASAPWPVLNATKKNYKFLPTYLDMSNFCPPNIKKIEQT